MPVLRETPTALILDDEPRYRNFLAEVLREMDYRPMHAGTADEAMRVVSSSPPDLLLLDLNLPVMDGISFLEEFRESCPEAPVVIITGFGSLKSARQAIRLGVSDFLAKPCDLGQIEQAIDRARRRTSKPGAPEQGVSMDRGESSTHDGIRPLAAVEREAIVEALRVSRGNRSEAARRLGISRRALYNKIAEYEREGHDVP